MITMSDPAMIVVAVPYKKSHGEKNDRTRKEILADLAIEKAWVPQKGKRNPPLKGSGRGAKGAIIPVENQVKQHLVELADLKDELALATKPNIFTTYKKYNLDAFSFDHEDNDGNVKWGPSNDDDDWPYASLTGIEIAEVWRGALVLSPAIEKKIAAAKIIVKKATGQEPRVYFIGQQE